MVSVVLVLKEWSDSKGLYEGWSKASTTHGHHPFLVFVQESGTRCILRKRIELDFLPVDRDLAQLPKPLLVDRKRSDILCSDFHPSLCRDVHLPRGRVRQEG